MGSPLKKRMFHLMDGLVRLVNMNAAPAYRAAQRETERCATTLTIMGIR